MNAHGGNGRHQVEQAQALNEPIYSRVMALIERLEDWPAVSGAKPLCHGLAATIGSERATIACNSG